MRASSLVLLLLGCCGASAWADDAQGWLERLAAADRQQSFQGTFVYERNGSFSTHGIWHGVSPDGVVRERLLQMDGPEQEVLLVDGRVRCFSGGLADQVADGQGWPARQLDLKKLATFYELQVLGPSRVAGRPAVALALLPRDPYRYALELHLDRETGVPLKSLLLSEKGQLLERFQYTQLQPVPALDPQVLQPATDCQAVAPATTSTSGALSWQSEWIPPGFDLVGISERRSPVSAERVQSMMFEDGLARFSIFVEPLRGAMVEDARSQLGPTVVVSRRIATEEGGVMVTVVGEVPLGTAERIALAIQPAVAQDPAP